MSLFLDSFWRAVAYCLHPRVIALSLLPLALIAALALGVGYFLWQPAVAYVQAGLDTWGWIGKALDWIQVVSASQIKDYVAPFLVIFAITPLIVLLSLIFVAMLMTPAIVALVAERRFANLERKKGGSFLASLLWSVGSTVLAMVALVLSLPLWLVPPLILLLPPLIWGWLTYRVMAYDCLADHASAAERRELIARHRSWLLGIGVLTGYLGAAPSVVWASGLLFVAAFFVLVPLAIWLYTLVFAFAALWFAHYSLAALDKLRAEQAAVPMPAPAQPPILVLPDASSPHAPARTEILPPA